MLNVFIETVESAVKDDNKIQLLGFGTFEARKRATREGKNPQTGAKIKIAACKILAFKVGKAFKDWNNLRLIFSNFDAKRYREIYLSRQKGE